MNISNNHHNFRDPEINNTTPPTELKLCRSKRLVAWVQDEILIKKSPTYRSCRGLGRIGWKSIEIS
jgi:hypothetical protein